MSLFNIVDRYGERLADADSLERMTEVVRNAPSGRYQVDVITVNEMSQ